MAHVVVTGSYEEKPTPDAACELVAHALTLHFGTIRLRLCEMFSAVEALHNWQEYSDSNRDRTVLETAMLSSNTLLLYGGCFRFRA